MFRAILVVLVLIFAAAPAGAFTSEWARGNHVKSRLVMEAGKFGVEIQTDEGWHTYYKDPGDAGIGTSFNWDGTTGVEIKEVTYPEPQEFMEYDLKTKGYSGNVFFPVTAEFEDAPHIELKVEGAVCKEICIPYSMIIVEDIPASDVSREDISASYWVIIWTALLAGLVLNIMPCVLPVLSLKVLAVVKQSKEIGSKARRNFLATSFGIIFSFWVLAGLAIALKNAGMAVGWGLHFQSPIFVAVLLAIVLVFAASLFGLFHLRPPSWIAGSGEHNTLAGNFFSGVLATLLGTSCTAPILVTAVGFALAGSAADIILVFTIMGVGMALPFLVFAIWPQIAAYLPKPGAWMNKVKMAMGVLLLGTAVWLGYVLYNQVVEPKIEMAENGEKAWEVFDEAAIAKHVAEGKVVLVDITADWCVNCKANKVAVLDTDEMKAVFSQPHIVLLRGDMTRPSKVLVEYIKKYNRYGIPFNMVYGASAKEGILLPPLLTKDGVKDALKKAR